MRKSNTIALRGIHDEAILGVREDQKREVLEEAIRDQRSILSEYIEKPIEDIPQIFVPYKEVLKIFEQGMDLPGDITIVWPDDNYGYMNIVKRLCNWGMSALIRGRDSMWSRIFSPSLPAEPKLMYMLYRSLQRRKPSAHATAFRSMMVYGLFLEMM
jgi:hypothetical protein